MRKRAEKIRVDCPECEGDGTVGSYGDEIGESIDCPACQGSGKAWDYPADEEYEPENDER
jgi:DnaJ-class molecular chaperone